MTCPDLGHKPKPADLAIVIPAYKAKYFRLTLESLAQQTDKGFNVYVGDDASPENLQAAVEEFSGRISLNYRKFETNLGQKDLVAHWSRCLDMVHDEEYVCLFSDDDIMGKECVAQFHACLAAHPDSDVYRFNFRIIDSSGNLKEERMPYPEHLSSGEFFRLLYSGILDARMPEFIFRTSVLKENGFVNFPRAYRSDNATVISCAFRTGIRTVPDIDSAILWRDSGINMSSSESAPDVMQHAMANMEFFNWTHRTFAMHGIPYPLPVRHEKRHIVAMLVRLYPAYGKKELNVLLKKYRPSDFRFSIAVRISLARRLLKKYLSCR